MGVLVALGSEISSAYIDITGGALLPNILIIGVCLLLLSVFIHILNQLVFKNKDEPPLIFSWFPILGSTVEYGVNRYKIFFKHREKYGNVFTFILLGKKHTVCLGPEGNDFILIGKLSEGSAAEIYRGLTVPTFGKDVCYDAPPAKLMEQKKLESHVAIFINEIQSFLTKWGPLQGKKGTFEVVEAIGVMSIFTASRSLQGREVRQNFNEGLADLYHDLDMSFIPLNFFFPWLPLPVNRRRDIAQQKIAAIYKNIIKSRREFEASGKTHSDDDMIWHLMRSTYKDGKPVPDHEIAHMMIGMLMAGQHTSSSIGAWILLRLASRPDIQEELYQEQLRTSGPDLPLPTSKTIGQLSFHRMVVRETLRIHAPIHSIMRAVKAPLTFTTRDPRTAEERDYIIPTSHVLISAPGVTAQSPEYFENPSDWDPHRWAHLADFLDGSEKTDELGYGPLSKAASSAYLPFGAGRHRCVGEHFAYLQLGTIATLLVREFKFRSVGGKEGVPPTDYESMFTRPVVPAYLEWERRSGKKAISLA